MVSSSTIESLAARFAPYIEELREFFTSRQLPFGSPAFLGPFVDHLSDPGFAEEMGSMLRSFLYREERLPRTEWMDMIAIAVGGLQVEDNAEALHEPMRKLLAFVGEVIRSQRTALPPELPSLEETSQMDSPEALPLTIAESPSTLPVGAGPALDLHLRSTPDGSLLAMDAAPRRINDRLAQSLAASALPDPFAPAIAAKTTSPSRNQGLARDVSSPRPRRTLLAVLQRSYWLPGVAVLLLVLIAGGFLRTRATNQPAPVTAAAPAVSVVNHPKPSPYTIVGPGSPIAANQRPVESLLTAGVRTASHEPLAAKFAKAQSLLPVPGESRFTPVAPTRAGHAVPSLTAHGGLTPREGVFLASSGAMASHLLSAPAPGYPKLASFTHVEGQVILQVVVARDGRVEATRVLDGPVLLRGAAEHAVRRWRYRPYTVDGKPTDVATIVTVSFRLRH